MYSPLPANTEPPAQRETFFYASPTGKKKEFVLYVKAFFIIKSSLSLWKQGPPSTPTLPLFPRHFFLTDNLDQRVLA